MLVLSRRENESIVIGDNIRVTVVRARGNRVTIAIEAPQEVPITREELLQRKSHPQHQWPDVEAGAA